MKKFIYVIPCLLLFGCFSRGLRTKGGETAFRSSAGATLATKQPENPAANTSQDFSSEDFSEVFLPIGTAIQSVDIEPAKGDIPARTNISKVILSSPAKMTRKHVENQKSDIGKAQKDTLGETMAKLKSTWWWSVVGFALLIGGLFGAFYPPATLILGGKNPGLAIAAGGLVIAALPIILIGHETFIIIAAIGILLSVLAIYFVHHSSQLHALLNFPAKKITGNSDNATKPVTVAPGQSPVPAGVVASSPLD